VRLYSSRAGVRYLVHDFCYAGEVNPLGLTANLNGQSIPTTPITGLNTPVHSLCFLFRWKGDLVRTLTMGAFGVAGGGPSDAFGHGPTGAGGRDPTNFNGWLQPLNTPVTANIPEPMIEFIELLSNNTSIVKKVRVLDLILDVSSRYYKGTAGIGIPILPYGFAPTLANANTGLVDFSLVDNLQLNSYTFNTPNGFATMVAYCTADIGDNAAATAFITLQIIGIGFNFLDIMAYDMFSVRPQ
jgi:hypothetical protein